MLRIYSKIPLAKPVINTPVIHITNAIRMAFELRKVRNRIVRSASINMAFITSQIIIQRRW